MLSRPLLSATGASRGSLGPARLAESRLVVRMLPSLLGSLGIAEKVCTLLYLLGSLGAMLGTAEYMSTAELACGWLWRGTRRACGTQGGRESDTKQTAE